MVAEDFEKVVKEYFREIDDFLFPIKFTQYYDQEGQKKARAILSTILILDSQKNQEFKNCNLIDTLIKGIETNDSSSKTKNVNDIVKAIEIINKINKKEYVRN